MKKLLLILFVLPLIPLQGQVFESPKLENRKPDKVNVKIGADFAMQYQMLNHSADSLLIPLGTGINLPTANFTIDAELSRGVQVSLTTYLSSRHHVEACVKGGYRLLDRIPFIRSQVLDNIMDYFTVKVGVMELNYGDAHFMRSDNGNVIQNPFVGNYIMDAFTTAPALELMFRNNGIIAMAGLTTGSLRPQLAGYSSFSGYTAYSAHKELALYGKAGYDNTIGDDFRLRVTY